MFLMLNPSTADEVVNDPTVERCERRARSMGFGQLTVCNLFAFRATDPGDMKAAADPVGPLNDKEIEWNALISGIVIVAWGNHGAHQGRSAEVLKLLRNADIKLHHLGLNASGEPKHPLYISYNVKPEQWK